VTNLFCVRADYGTDTTQFVNGGYVAIDYSIDSDLATVAAREQLNEIYRDAHPKEKSDIVIGQQVGQLARFLFDMKTGGYVITPAADTDGCATARWTPIRPTTLPRGRRLAHRAGE
jgi:predicted Mrr-cat superfamily restriction endonuclease